MSGALTTAISIPIVTVLVLLVDRAGATFFLYAWLFLASVIIGLTLLYPVAIAPLFNRFSPLPQGSSLQARITDLARQQGFPVCVKLLHDPRTACAFPSAAPFAIALQLSKVLVMDGSTRSAHSNAYFVGLCRDKQIVL